MGRHDTGGDSCTSYSSIFAKRIQTSYSTFDRVLQLGSLRIGPVSGAPPTSAKFRRKVPRRKRVAAISTLRARQLVRLMEQRAPWNCICDFTTNPYPWIMAYFLLRPRGLLLFFN